MSADQAKVILIECDANGNPTPYDREYVVAYNPDTEYGTLDLTTTPDPAKALRFPGPVEAFRFCKRVSALQPTRPDGQPNRPITGLCVWIENAPEE